MRCGHHEEEDMIKTTKPVRAAVLSLAIAAALTLPSAAQEDTRQMVKLPPMMQEHLLGSMRDHLAALNDILSALAQGDVDTATDVAENRLGMSSLSKHGASELGKYYPEGMQAIGTELHHAASQFVIVARDAELEPGLEAQHAVYDALNNITTACNACHQSYRIR